VNVTSMSAAAPPAAAEPAAEPPPPPSAEDVVHGEHQDVGSGSEPWVLRLGTYLNGKSLAEEPSEPWAVRLGNYLRDKRPGPWSILANERPHDPMALRLGTFLNETKPIKILHRADGSESEQSEPVVLRLGNFLNGAQKGADETSPPSVSSPTPSGALSGKASTDPEASAEPHSAQAASTESAPATT